MCRKKFFNTGYCLSRVCELMRYALKFGYNGRNFSGYARQPGLKTVEGEIINALKKTTIISDEKDANLKTASRTDKGVSACGNVMALNTKFRKSEILQAMNANLKKIWFYGIAEVPIAFNPRHARLRWYRYHIFDESIDRISLEETANIFLGKHDFSNYAKLEEGKDPIRSLDAIEITQEKGFITVDFKAQNFLWHMVRRIVKAMIRAAEEKLSLDDIKEALETRQKADFGVAQPDPLILMDVKYDFEFNIDYTRLRDLETKLENNLRGLLIDQIIYDNSLKILKE